MPGAAGAGVTLEIDGSGFITDAQADLDRVVVLANRVITHNVTSMNDELLNDGTISGTFRLVDTYYNLAFRGQPGDPSYTVIISRNPAFDGPAQRESLTPTVTGEFTLTLGDLQNIDPSQ